VPFTWAVQQLSQRDAMIDIVIFISEFYFEQLAKIIWHSSRYRANLERAMIGSYSAPSSRTMETEAEAPMRLAPASSRERTSARVRIPPAALTPQRAPATPRSRATSAAVAPPVKAGRSLDEVRAGLDGDFRAAQFSST